VAFDSTGRFFGGSDSTAALKVTVAAGQYRVVIQVQGYAGRTVTLSSPSQQTIGMTPGGTLVIRSSGSAPRAARLLDANGQLYERSIFGNSQVMLNASPASVTLTNIAPGIYTVQVLDEQGLVSNSTKVTIVEGQTAETSL
jgi:hypothetical protein